MHVHQVLDTSEEYKAKYGYDIHRQKISSEVAFLKHIRPMTHIDEKNETILFPCHFGKQSDPEGYHLRVSV